MYCWSNEGKVVEKTIFVNPHKTFRVKKPDDNCILVRAFLHLPRTGIEFLS
jgi:hypothetical protein